jgi:hypothetical protein
MKGKLKKRTCTVYFEGLARDLEPFLATLTKGHYAPIDYRTNPYGEYEQD